MAAGRRARSASAPLLLVALTGALGCQPGMTTTPAVVPVPPSAVGARIYLPAEPTVDALDDPDARPLTVALEHAVRDALEEAGWKVGDSPVAAGGLHVRVHVTRASRIQADVFIHGAEACGVEVALLQGDTVLATATPEASCVSTSAYYGMLAKDAAVAMVNRLSRNPAVIAAASAVAARSIPWASAP